MSDPHDRPYTFGWHGEIIRRPTRHCSADDPCGLTRPGCACGDEIRAEDAAGRTGAATRATRTPGPHPSSTDVIPGPQNGAHERETR